MSQNTQNQRWWPSAYPTQACAEQLSEDDYEPVVPEPKEERPRPPNEVHALKNSQVRAPGGRTIVVCLDGTGDKFDGDNSNVVSFVSCLKKDDPTQVTYYQSGIGTYDGQGLKGGISAGFDMAIGSGLGIHIKDAYRFLMQTYREGDRICLFGFSRGAYTVRCLAGMLHKVGLLPAHNITQVQFAYEMYKDDSTEGWSMSRDFKKTFSMDIKVHFVGVWDCVASVGFIPRKLPLSSTSTSWVQHFRHAMSLDERRSKFKICQWQQQNLDSLETILEMKQKGRVKAKAGQLMHQAHEKISRHPKDGDKESKQQEKKKENKKEKRKKKGRPEEHHPPTDALEVWFAGCHADVGGGAELNEVRHKLARIPLRWMIRQCFDCNTGIIFNTAALAETGIDIHNVWPIYKPPVKPFVGPPPGMVDRYYEKTLPVVDGRLTALELSKQEQIDKLESEDLLPEHVEDYFDARANINDQLKLAKFWWVLEFWPVKLRVEKDPGEWQKVVGLNKGRYRIVREIEPKMHWTVERRMNETDYKVGNSLGTYASWKVST